MTMTVGGTTAIGPGARGGAGSSSATLMTTLTALGRPSGTTTITAGSGVGSSRSGSGSATTGPGGSATGTATGTGGTATGRMTTTIGMTSGSRAVGISDR